MSSTNLLVTRFVPDEADCTWGGLGDIGDKDSWEKECNHYTGVAVRLHELGHK